jgi:hypothetical protein
MGVMNQLISGGPYLVVKRKQQVDMFKNNGWKQISKEVDLHQKCWLERKQSNFLI